MSLPWRRRTSPVPAPSAAAPDLDRELADVRDVWEGQARSDPLWAILSEPDKRGGRWDLDAFFAEGTAEISRVMERVLAVAPDLPCGLAVDFGCGVGRLSQPLATYFDRVVGVDISPTMIELAGRFDRTGGRVGYVENNAHDLRFLDDAVADLVYSNIVLQHVGADLARAYLAEFFRITRPGGFLVFQMPSHFSEQYLPADATEEPVRPAACRAEIRLVEPLGPMVAGRPADLALEVRNVAAEPWRQAIVRQLNVGNHWLTSDGARHTYDDGRQRLPSVVAPGGRAEVTLRVQAPDEPGRYQLVLDVVQEGVRWFANAGSVPLIVAATVVAPEAAPSDDAAIDPRLLDLLDPEAAPRPFSMAGIPVEEMKALITASGGELLSLDEHVTEWHSFTYHVRRLPVPVG